MWVVRRAALEPVVAMPLGGTGFASFQVALARGFQAAVAGGGLACSVAIATEPPSHVALVDVSGKLDSVTAGLSGHLAVPDGDKPTGMCMCVHRVPGGGTAPVEATGPQDAACPTAGGCPSVAPTATCAGGVAADGDGAECTISVETVFAGYEDGSLVRYSVDGGKAVPEDAAAMAARESVFSEPLLAITSNRAGTLGVCGGAVDELAVFSSTPSGGGLVVQKRHAIANKGINTLAMREDEKLVASGGWDGRIRLFSWPKFNPLAILSVHRDGVAAVRFSGRLPALDGGWMLAAASKDNRISLWSVYN